MCVSVSVHQVCTLTYCLPQPVWPLLSFSVLHTPLQSWMA